MNRAVKLGCGVLAVFGLGGCSGGGDAPYTIQFAAQVAGDEFACGMTYPSIGLSASSMTPIDFRLYVHDVQLERSSGEPVALALDADGVWQRDGVALIDFENATGACSTGTPDVRTQITGTAPEHDDYRSISFKVGLPKSMNHLDAARAPAPFNVPGMCWSWRGGYKFIRMDVQTPKTESYYFHLGATDCAGDVNEGFICARENVPEIRLENFDATTNNVVIDMAELYAGLDLDRQAPAEGDTMPGCMGGAGDPECPALFQSLGMPFEGQESAATTKPRFFQVQ